VCSAGARSSSSLSSLTHQLFGFCVSRRELLLAAKAEDKAKSDWWLFFGCRNENKDFLYRTELEGSVERGVLHKLTAAFSRDSEEVHTTSLPPYHLPSPLGRVLTRALMGWQVVYVQHRMVEHGADIADRLLNSNASIYVCGDGAGVVKGVNAAVVEILEKFGGLEPTAAKDRHASLLKDRRLLFDVW
jgi:sulfite reductase alpha subunit-like flavoprotein